MVLSEPSSTSPPSIPHLSLHPQHPQHPHPLTLPEILALVASALDADNAVHDLAICCRVSVLFHASFTPALYSFIDLRHSPPTCYSRESETSDDPENNMVATFKAALARNGRLVRSLRAEFLQFVDPPNHLPTFVLPYLRNLHTLRISQSWTSNSDICEADRGFQAEHWQDLVTLLRQNSATLREITIQMMTSARFPTELWSAIANISTTARAGGKGIKLLRIYGAIIDDSDQELWGPQEEPAETRGFVIGQEGLPGIGSDGSNNNELGKGRRVNVDAFLDACHNVQRLDLDYTTVVKSTSSSASFFDNPASRWNQPWLFPNLREFSFFGRTNLNLDFFGKCLRGTPALRKLSWSTRHHSQYAPATLTPQVMRQIVSAANHCNDISHFGANPTASAGASMNADHTLETADRPLAHLESLNLWDGMPFTDDEIANILSALPAPLKELHVAESGFADLSLAALFQGEERQTLGAGPERMPVRGVTGIDGSDSANSEQYPSSTPTGSPMDATHLNTTAVRLRQLRQRRIPHSAMLRHLDLTDCMDVTEDMARLIRWSCPHLKTLTLEMARP